MKKNILTLAVFIFILFPLHSQDKGLHDLFMAKGTMMNRGFLSPSLADNVLYDSQYRNVNIYLPPGYKTSPNNVYPVLYLLHGFGGWYDTFFQNETYGFNLKYMLDTLINRNLLTPIIVVSPDASNKFYGSWYTNSEVAGNWEDFIVKDLVEYMDSTYRTLKAVGSRGITGHSMGGYGSCKIAMKHPDTFSAAYPLSGLLSLNIQVTENYKDYMLDAKKAETFDELHTLVQILISEAAAFAPDTSVKPFFGQFPLDASGELIDTIWRRWLEHDPLTMINEYKDSILKLRAFQFDCGRSDLLMFDPNVLFSQVLTENEIEHTFLEYDGDHFSGIEGRFQDHVLPFFSKHLDHVLPGISRKSASYLESSDTLVFEMDRDGIVYIVSQNTSAVLDSIVENQIASLAATANSVVEFPLTDMEYGDYIAFGVDTSNSAISIPLPFAVDKIASSPTLTLARDTCMKNDTIFASSDKDGTIFLVNVGTTPENIFSQRNRIKDQATVTGGNSVGFLSAELYPKEYLVYAEDKYGLFSEPLPLSLVEDATEIFNSTSRGIQLFPNPASNMITLETQEPGPYSLEIISLNGQQILMGEMDGTTHQIDLSSFQKGVYLITIRSKGKLITEKIVKL